MRSTQFFANYSARQYSNMNLLATLSILLYFSRHLIKPSSVNAPQFKDPTLVMTTKGPVAGSYDYTTWTHKRFYQYKGIPYARSPSKNYRFKLPVEPPEWTEAFKAIDANRRCPELATLEKTPNVDVENCLNLCVYTKNLNAKQAVMFYIYGGGFYNGSNSDHPPNYLLESDIVLVVPNYRIGAFAWISALTPALPGNLGIADVQLALKWVQDNIAEFGGDPERITIVGQSAGGAIGSALMLSPTTLANAFNGAILQSGSIFAFWAINHDPRSQLDRIAKATGCANSPTLDNVITCLENVSVEDLLAASSNERFSPVIGDPNNILPQSPNVLIKQYNRNIPVMTGFCKHDGTFVLAEVYDAIKNQLAAIGLDYNNITVRQFAEHFMAFNNDSTHLTENLMEKLLFDKNVLDTTDHKKALFSYIDLANVLFFKSPAVTLASQLLKFPGTNKYIYSFEYVGEYTRFGYGFDTTHYPFNGGVHHSNDLIYLFPTYSLNKDDTEMAQTMVELWTSFITKGVPKIYAEQKIPKLLTPSGPYFHINKAITLSDDLLSEFTATINDPNNVELDRPNVSF